MNLSNSLVSDTRFTRVLLHRSIQILSIILISWQWIALPAFSQQIINRTGRLFSSDDGNPAYDADGVRNGTVVWSGGAVHVVNRYEVYGTAEFPTPTLIISSGAIVKFAGTFSTSGGITWTPPSSGFIASRGFSFPESNVTFVIEGATLTDIRDDAVGGDTNGDGTASTPSLSGWGHLRLPGSPRDRIANSTIKYCTEIRHIGSMEFTGNTFRSLGGIRSGNTLGDIVLNASPRFTGNTFHRSLNISGAVLDLRGMSPIVENNTFRDSVGQWAIWVGPGSASSGGRIVNVGPTSGTIVISNNRIETPQGIRLSEESPQRDSLSEKGAIMRAEIRGNTMRATMNTGAALQLTFQAEAKVSDNNISNYGNPITWFYDNRANRGDLTQVGLRINNNRFSLEGVSPTFAVGWIPPPTSPAALSGVLIDMKNNDWGDPSGPLDTTVSDGRSNTRGRGLKVISNTIDYVPFIGAANPPQTDVVRLSVSSPGTSAPLTPGSNVTLSSTIDFYDLVSAPTGQIVVLLRGADGIILNNPGTIVNVTSGNHTATIPPIQFTVPTFGNVVTVQAGLVPTGDFYTVSSNLISYGVNQPPSSLQLSTTGPTLVRGNTETQRVDMTYTLATTNPGTIELDFKERRVGTGEVLTDFPLISIPAPTGTNQTLTHTAMLEIPLRNVDVHLRINGEVVLEARLKNDAGLVVSRQQRVLAIDENANRVRITRVRPFGYMPGQPNDLISRQHFTTGFGNAYYLYFGYTISTRNVTAWQVWDLPKVLDGSGNLIRTYPGANPLVANGSTGTVTEERSALVDLVSGIPSEARKLRVVLRLVASGGLTVGLDSVEYPVLSPVATTSRVISAGASQVAFTPITATLNFTANQTAGLGVAEEFNGQYGTTAGSSMTQAVLENFYWRFIPLLRYWSVYDTLRDGTFTASVAFSYTPADFPPNAGFREDSLVICGFNPLSGQLEALPSTLNMATRTISTQYTKFFGIWVVASKSTILVNAPPFTGQLSGFSLAQNYPNPFNPTTTINYQLPTRSYVTLKVFDILGREVGTLVNEVQDAGFKSTSWDASGFASGVYLYRLQAGDFADVKKLVLLR